ncbi:hypothetical protein Tco_0006024 [Tanacetum coccineum]
MGTSKKNAMEEIPKGKHHHTPPVSAERTELLFKRDQSKVILKLSKPEFGGKENPHKMRKSKAVSRNFQSRSLDLKMSRKEDEIYNNMDSASFDKKKVQMLCIALMGALLRYKLVLIAPEDVMYPPNPVSDKSSEPKTNDFASCDSSDKSSSPKSVESSVFSPRVAEFPESNLKTAAQEDISFNNNTPYFSSVKDDKHSSFGCNKNGLRHCVKNKVYGSKSCFVCGSFSHLIKDCDFYENKMGVYSVQRESRPMWNNVDNIPPFIPQAAAGHTWKMYMGEGRWGTAVKSSAGCSWRDNRPYLQRGSKNNGGSQQSTWKTPHVKIKDIGNVDSGFFKKQSAILDDSAQYGIEGCSCEFQKPQQAGKEWISKRTSPPRFFSNEHNCVACNKGKQHKASYKAITAVSTITEPLLVTHLRSYSFGPTFHQKVLVTSPHNKTPYELLSGKGAGHEWYFDLDYLTDTLGYTRFKANQPTGAQDTHINADRFIGYAVDADYASKQEHEAKGYSRAIRLLMFTTDTKELLRQATIEARRNLDPAGSVPFCRY